MYRYKKIGTNIQISLDFEMDIDRYIDRYNSKDIIGEDQIQYENINRQINKIIDRLKDRMRDKLIDISIFRFDRQID